MPEQPFSIDDFFGDQPNRPDDPAFWRLSEIVLSLDSGLDPSASQEEADAAFAAKFERVGLPKDVVFYVAMQRTMRVLGITTVVGLMAQFERVTQMAAVWADGACAGVLFERGTDASA